MYRKTVFVLLLLLLAGTMFAYEVGDTVEDLSWTDSNGEEHSIYDLTAAGKIVLFFWGDQY